MHHDEKLKAFPLRVTLLIKKKSAREQPLQNNHKYGSIIKNSTRILIHQDQVPPELKLIVIDLK